METELIEARIRGIAFGGDGVGTITSDGDRSGKVAFIPFTAPGDLVTATVATEKSRQLEAALAHIVEPSSVRVAPKCRHFGECGGCSLQHLGYEAACEAKREMIVSAFRAAGLPGEFGDMVAPVWPSPPYGWRRRASLHIDSEGRAGFYRSKTHSVLPLDECSVLTPILQSKLPTLHRLGWCLEGHHIALEIEDAGDKVGVCLELNEPAVVSRAEDLVNALAPDWDRVVVKSRGVVVASCGRNHFFTLPLTQSGTPQLWLVPGAFSQVNWGVNLAMLNVVSERATSSGSRTAHDLYAGSGNFALLLASRRISTVAVECHSALADAALQAAQAQSLDKHLSVHSASVQQFLKVKRDPVDLIVADPPRSGLGPLAAKVGYGRNLFLISCYLPSLVRDLRSLIDDGWAVKEILPFDMFPQTTYVEVFVHLLRK